jgi:transglutaminase-like putative cysteine protease
VVENTFRDPTTKGCGVGDVKYMLETNNLGGKCADINAVYVALARSAGLPARDVYGIRVNDSVRGYKSLGKFGDITKAQHCRAEFFAKGYGWIAVDPADVRKVILEEPGNLNITDPKVTAIREYLFGNWEMNWMAYNYGHDISLPGSRLGAKGKIGFLMYPQAETFDGRIDALDPENFKYKITSRKIG